MRRNTTSALAALVGLVGGTLMLLAPAAGAQTPYQAGGCASPTVDAGAHAIGSSFSFVLGCPFDPGSTVTITVNGQTVGTKTADASGAVTVNVTVVSQTVLQINDPVTAPGQCGPNSVVATGPANGSTGSITGGFTVLCPAGVVTAVPRRGVAFTGANILRWGAVAMLLVAVGAVLIVADRRRAKARD